MKAEELRIGNYFEWIPIASMGRGVDQITSGQQIDDYKDFKRGIPLTEEWLKKFGFVRLKNWQDSWMWLVNFGINFHAGSWHWNDMSKSKKIEYVHQLQNLYFALTGEELVSPPIE